MSITDYILAAVRQDPGAVRAVRGLADCHDRNSEFREALAKLLAVGKLVKVGLGDQYRIA